MVGRDVVFSIKKTPASPEEVVFEARSLGYIDANGATRLKDVSFDVRRGEIVGIAGGRGGMVSTSWSNSLRASCRPSREESS